MRNKRGTNVSLYSMIDQFVKNPHLESIRVRHLGTIEEIGRIGSILKAIPHYEKFIAGSTFPSTIEQIGTEQSYPAASLNRELLWEISILSHYARKLDLFISHLGRFETLFLTGKFIEGIDLLDGIEQECGKSIWSLEQRISLLQEVNGLQLTKSFCESIISNKDMFRDTSILVYLFGVRSGKKWSFSKFNQLIEEQVTNNPNIGSAIQSYIGFRVNLWSWQPAGWESILAHGRSFTLVDRYLALIRSLQYLCAGHHQNLISAQVRERLSRLSSVIHDYKLRNLLFDLGLARFEPDEDTASFHEVLEAYTRGDYSDAFERAKQLIVGGVAIIPACEILVKSSIRLGKSAEINMSTGFSLLDKIISNINEIFRDTDNADTARFELCKICQTNSSHSWASQINAILRRDARGDTRKHVDYIACIADFDTAESHPRKLLTILTEESRTRYRQNYTENYGTSKTLQLLSELARENSNFDVLRLDGCIPDDRVARYEAVSLMRQQRYKEAASIFETLGVHNDSTIYQPARINLSWAFLEIGQLSDCLETVVGCYIANQNTAIRLPIIELVGRLDVSPRIDSLNPLPVAILYSAYSRVLGPHKNERLEEAYEDFLESLDLKRPSDIKDICHKYDKDQLCYILYYICVPDIMDCSPILRNSDDLENERIKVCQILIELDESQSSVYSAEIRELTRQLMTRGAIRSIDQSRIYVDIAGIKKSVEKNQREMYARYLEVRQLDVTSDDLNTILGRLFSIVQASGKRSERFSLLIEMITELRNKFVSSNEYGLDSYLSVSIRHGTLSGQLRGPLESTSLITQKDKYTDIYRDNLFWNEDRIGPGVTKDLVKRIVDRLTDFSRVIDNLIDTLKNRWIQINIVSYDEKGEPKSNNPEGLFVYDIRDLGIPSLDRAVTPQTTYEEFVDKVVSLLWKQTERNLSVVRSRISIDLKEEFNTEFRRLQHDLDTLRGGQNISALTDCISSTNTLIQDELDNIASWFTLSQSADVADYELILPIDVANNQIRNIYPKTKFRLTKNIHASRWLLGRTLKPFAEIFFMLFNNAVKHSELEKIEVTISVTEADSVLKIVVENIVNEATNTEDTLCKIREIRESMESRATWDPVRREGGSGFHKIAKILAVDVVCDYSLEFGFSDKNQFRVTLSVETEGITRCAS